MLQIICGQGFVQTSLANTTLRTNNTSGTLAEKNLTKIIPITYLPSTTDNPCPLCAGTTIRDYAQDNKRHYHKCDTCSLVYVPPQYHLEANDEKAEYDHHENDPKDLRYREFLSRLSVPLLDRLKAGSKGLDFGCGPGPTLSLMLKEAGHSAELYDIFYATDASVLEKTYDFISATEVVEHLAAPGDILRKLWAMLASGGTLALMTKLVINKDRFQTWHYKNDQTHIAFFSKATFVWLAGDLGAKLEFIDSDVIFLTKEPTPKDTA